MEPTSEALLQPSLPELLLGVDVDAARAVLNTVLWKASSIRETVLVGVRNVVELLGVMLLRGIARGSAIVMDSIGRSN